MKPQEFSTLGMYGRKEVFEKRQREGYNEVAFGNGEWTPRYVTFPQFTRQFPFVKLVREPITEIKFSGMFVFFHPERGIVRTLETQKFVDPSLHTVRGAPEEHVYSIKGFGKYLQENRIVLGQRQDLAEVLQSWD